MDSTLDRDAFMPHQPKGMGAGLMLAILAHLLLIAALSFGVHWRASQPAGVEAELWAAVPQIAAPRANEPEPRPEPRPEPPPVKQVAPPAPVEPPPVPRVNDAQIAIEKAKKAEKAKQEEARKEAARREEAQRKDEARKLEQQQREQAAKREAAEREKAREKEAQERKNKELAEAQQAKALEAQRQANLKRITGMAGASGDERATGAALQSAGPSAGYAGRIRARIKPNIVFADSIQGNPVATVEVRVAPDGTITSRRIVKTSGVAAWDDAVLRAIDRTEVLPKDTDGRIPPSFALEFKPRE